MVMHYYYNYICQVCGKGARTNQTMKQVEFNAPTCIVCHRVMCYKCKIGGFCKICIDLFPEDIRKPYEKKAKILKMFRYSYILIGCIFALLCFGIFIILLVDPFNYDLVIYSLFTLVALLGYLICPGLIIQFIVKSIESKFSDMGARKLIIRFQQKEKFI